MANMNIDQMISVADILLRLGVSIVERHAGTPIANMTVDDIRKTVDSINIQSADSLDAIGQARAKGGQSTPVSAPVSSPVLPPSPESFEDEGDDQGVPV